MNRRSFLYRSALGGGTLLVPRLASALGERRVPRLTILHTNDWHSRIDPFPDDGSRNAGLGGAIRRAALIDQIRAVEPETLLLDSGDIFQGTPYFNFFLGELEMKLMSQMGYDAATIGNHDFDGGLDNLAAQSDRASFPLLNANYDMTGTSLAGRVRPYRVFERAGLRIGVFGLGIDLVGLVPPKLFGPVRYQDPVTVGNATAEKLKREEGCDLIVCLSHLGFRYRDGQISDVTLAAASRNIDLILGGHTHTFLDRPVVIDDAEGRPVVINQVGFAGLRLGRLDIAFPRKGEVKCVACSNLRV